MKFIVVENRKNESVLTCFSSLDTAGVDYDVIDEQSAGVEFENFSKIYQHMSSNTREFELICFRRYFLIKNHIAKKDINQFVLLDSDVLVFDGIDEHIKKIVNNQKFIGSYIKSSLESDFQISPHCSFWTKDALCDFIDFTMNIYGSEDGLCSLREINNKFVENNKRGGVSDMTILYLWAKKRGHLDSVSKVVNGAVIDHNFSLSSNYFDNEFSTSFWLKKIIFFDGKPVLKKREGGALCFVFLLHFQGRAKLLMPSLANKKMASFILRCAIIGLAKKAKRFHYKLKSMMA